VSKHLLGAFGGFLFTKLCKYVIVYMQLSLATEWRSAMIGIIGAVLFIAALYGHWRYTFGNFNLIECRAARIEIERELAELAGLRDIEPGPEKQHVLNVRYMRLVDELNRLDKRIGKLADAAKINA
jgi:hypothetical protein